ncbi:MAG TPA: sulfurtransferase TusA family protein [Candidatus Tectomicrobia bacterium]|nr:sulfurtransferase TusA family protein [Candidatus Tectomicrobia bacterium]
MAIPADHTLDCLGLFCPIPVLRTREAIERMGRGQVIAVLSDDPGSEADMTSWTARAGHELLEIAKDGEVFRFVLRKAR